MRIISYFLLFNIPVMVFGLFKDAPLYRPPYFTYLLQGSQLKIRSNYNFLPTAAPDIGIYGTPYDFLDIRAFIELDPQMPNNTMPAVIQNEVAKANKLYNFIQIRILKPNHKVYNVVFHFFYELMSGIHQFDYYLPMGLFEGTNVKETGGGTSIPFNRFEKRQLNTHPGTEYAVSPNNGLFEVLDLSKPASFWLAGTIPEKKALSISYVILLPPGPIEQEIYHQYDNRIIRSVKDLTNVFKHAIDTYIPADKKQLYYKAYDEMLRILTVQPRNEIEKLKMQLISLKEQLNQLMQKLRNL